MKTRTIDYLNIGLILLSLLLTYFLPFRLFIFGYAILGPLHYLTEISWLRDKNYFVKEKGWLGLVIAAAAIFMLPFLAGLPGVSEWLEGKALQLGLTWLGGWTDSMILIPFVLAFGLVFAKKRSQLLIFITVGVVLAIALHFFSFYHILIGLFLPTVIHVYLFTMLFMLFGALKSKSKPGVVGVVLAAVIPVVIIFLPLDPESYQFPQGIKDIFVANNFHFLPANLNKVLGATDGQGFFFYREQDLRLEIFIAFAYIYHYLNWFSKTTLIGWAKEMTWSKGMVIGVIWLLSMGLYWYDYTIGVIVLLFLSMIHVFLEFPLNVISAKGIITELKTRISGADSA